MDPLYIAARRVLLDALTALANHRSAVIIVGAQAIYLRTGGTDLDSSVAPYTTDADLALNPKTLGTDPRISEAMQAAGFARTPEPGIWAREQLVDGKAAAISVDLLVPETVAGPGRRSASLPDHGRHVARRTPGLEAALVDNTEELICSLEPNIDDRQARVLVAGVGALIIAKCHKLQDRVTDSANGKPARLRPKDAGDVVRLMQCARPDTIGTRLAALQADPIGGHSIQEGVTRLLRLFGGRQGPGTDLAVRALQGAMDERRIRPLAAAYTKALREAYERGSGRV